MSAEFLREASVEHLRESVAENLDRYRSGDFAYLTSDTSHHLGTPVATNDAALDDLKIDKSSDHDAENSMVVHKYMAGLSLYEARDERLWCYLSHTTFLPYSRVRWSIPADDEDAVDHVRLHFFARTKRQIERDHAVSRLWWMGHLCSRVDGLSQEEALDALLHRTDVRANLVERPTVAQSTNVFSVVTKNVAKSIAGTKALVDRKAFRDVMRELNSIGGFRLLDALPQGELEQVFSGILTRHGISEP